jgi:acyl-CoA thioester hydrolase
MPLPTPFVAHTATVLPEWIDRNGHLNLAYYIVIFDHATDALFDALGIGSRFTEVTGTSLFVVETHTTYERELKLGECVTVNALLLGADAKRLHFTHEMFRADGSRAASHELLALHVNMATRRSAPFSAESAARLSAAVASHAKLPRPTIVGRKVGEKPRTE